VGTSGIEEKALRKAATRELEEGGKAGGQA
jgi:hypothetical protein